MDSCFDKNEEKTVQETVQTSSETKKKKAQKSCPNSSHNVITRKRRNANNEGKEESDLLNEIDEITKFVEEEKGEPSKHPQVKEVQNNSTLHQLNPVDHFNKFGPWEGPNFR